MNKEKFYSRFGLGSHLCREPMPGMDELKHDMRLLKEQGFNLVKLQESWLTDEPEEGVYRFEPIRELVAFAAELDLGVYLGVSMEHAPAWVWRNYPGARMEGRDGTRIAYEAQFTIPADGKPGPCFDDPGADAAQLRFLRALVTELAPFENIVVWNVWQEMGYEGERLTGHKVCYCPATIAAFQRWLQEEFHTLDALNQAWKSRYTRWGDVVPNRDLGRFALSNNIAYEYFLNNVRISRILRRRAEAIRAADPLRRPVFAHQGSSTVGSGIDWSFARAVDFLGCSCYPAWFHLHSWDDVRRLTDGARFRHEALLNEMWESVALKFDYLRGSNPAGAPIWGAEFQGGPICTGLYKGRVPGAADIRRWMLTAVSCGANAISYWVTRAEIQGHEINGYSLLDSSGDATPRMEEAARIGRALNRYPALFAPGNVPKAPVAILVSSWNHWLCTQLKGSAEEHLMYSTRGWHRLLWELGVPVDFVESGSLTEGGLDGYAMAVLPFPLALEEAELRRLTEYVERGGTLVSEACPGRFTRFGYGVRGELAPAAAALFGVTHRSLCMVEEPEHGARWQMEPLSWGDYAPNLQLCGAGPLAGCSVRPNLYLETFAPVAGTEGVLYADGELCGTRRRHGKGQAVLLGSFIGHSGTAYRDAASRAFVRRLCALAGVTPAHNGRLLLRELRTAAGSALFLTNPTAAPVTEQVRLPENCRYAVPLLEEAPAAAGASLSVTVQPLDVAVILCFPSAPV